MKSYPSTSTKIQRDIPIYAFDKLDGSQIRAEWSKKRRWYKFGTKTRLLDPNEYPLGEAQELFNIKYGEYLTEFLSSGKHQHAIAFFEFFGENSFAGNHEKEKHKVLLFDIALDKKGIMSPQNFIDTFVDRISVATPLYYGKANKEFEEKVMDSALFGMTFEGVVCKGTITNGRHVEMFKIKSRAWLDKLKCKCGTDDKLYHILA